MKAEDYLQVAFSDDCEVYVLLVNERAAVPPWVESKFTKVSESKMAVKLEWHLPLHIKMMALMSQKLQTCTRAHLNVWRGKETCRAGRKYTFGGNEGRDTLADYTYIFAWRPLNTAARAGAELAGAGGLHHDVNRGAEESLRLLQRAQAELEVQAVGDELDAFGRTYGVYQECRRAVLDAGGDAAEQLRLLRPWYVTHDGLQLTAACAAKTVSLELVLVLIKQGAELDEAACRYLLNKVATNPESLHGAGFRDLRHLMLHYVYSRRRPLSSTLALAKVLDEVAVEKKAKYQEYTQLATTLRQLAMALVEKLDALEAAAAGAAGNEASAAAAAAAAAATSRAPAVTVAETVPAGTDGGFDIGEVREKPHICDDDDAYAGAYVGSEGGAVPAVAAAHVISGGVMARVVAAPAAAGSPPKAAASHRWGNGTGPAAAGDTSDDDADPDAAYAADDAAAAGRPAGGGGGVQAASLDDVLILPQHTPSVQGAGGQQHGPSSASAAPSLNDMSPLDLACETKDVDFVSTSVVQGYLQRWWVGVDYTATALQDYGKMLSYFDHHMTLRILQNGGFVGGLGMLAVRYFSYLVHFMLFSSRPFYDSPRGRWAFRLMCEAFFLYIFHSVQLADHQTFMWQHAVLVLHVASMIVDEIQELMAFYEGRPVVYFRDGFNIIEGITMVLLVCSGACKATTFVLTDGEDDSRYADLQTAADFLFNTASIFVWARLLQFMIPLYDGMGSLLMVISKMTIEVLKFALPGVVIMLGVAFTMYATYRGRGIPGMDSFWQVMLLLFRTFLGETMFDTLSDETSTLYIIYGNIVVLLYAIAAAVVLANLLIALISSHFEPERAQSQSRLQRADMVNSYNFMVRKQLLGAPFSLPLLVVTELLPSGLRAWAGDYGDGWNTYLVLPMDGLPMPPETRKERRYPKGSRELPYVIYLLTFYPLVMVVTWSAWLVLAPYCLAYFALYGYRNWLEVLRSTDPGEEAAEGDDESDRPLGNAAPPQVLKGIAGAALGGGSGRLQQISVTAAASAGAHAAAVTRANHAVAAPARPPSTRLHSASNKVRPGSATLGAKGAAAAATASTGFSLLGALRAALAWFLLGLEPRKRGKGSKLTGRRHKRQDKGAAATWQHEEYQPWDHQERAASLTWLTLNTLAYVTSRPVWLLLGLLLYVGALGGLLLLAWGGVYQWLWRVCYYSHWVLRGWVEGWFPALDQKPAAAPGGKQQQQHKAGEEQDGAVGLEAVVGLQWAKRLAQPPALSPADVRGAMRDAGLTEGDVALAVKGAGPHWKAVEKEALETEQLRRADKGLVRRLTAVIKAQMKATVREALVEAGVVLPAGPVP
ncbi:hypothetical protein HXX76_004304 [Chlamydomonas incerta]|uniref:Ion transport domain-containing protein n=1 Tax=Chlamydomonas incerta TaxID=51695 RepID=A0A835TAP6_CHLIN|nr:hypothetical protein HXX76_004304 [Chlamydomonas incerta]|eukprot:KAG2440192.1 hypothetical protein HXX76_004304 [Chlamydomonas incerta]